MSDQNTIYHTRIADIGEIAIRPLCPEIDSAIVHRWVTKPYARFWGMENKSAQDIAAFYRDFEQSGEGQGYLGLHDGNPSFLVEVYDPQRSPLAELDELAPGDLGLHFLVAPNETPIRGFTTAVFRAVVDCLFMRLGAERLVVEPDARNHKIHAINRRAGFRHQRVVQLGDKRAYLGFCTRQQFKAALELAVAEDKSLVIQGTRYSQRASAVRCIEPNRWHQANRQLVMKMIAEFSHERLLEPLAIEQEDQLWRYRLEGGDSSTSYTFLAQRLDLDHWQIQPESLQKQINGEPQPLDAQAFILEHHEALAIPNNLLPVYLEEISCTLYSLAFKYRDQAPDSQQLVDADFQTIEAAMSEGHPSFVANSGRIGFDAHDYLHYAPEAASPIRLVWLAVHRRRATFTCSQQLDYTRLINAEIDIDTRERFEAKLRTLGLEPGDYWLMPIHPWQWLNKLSMVFAADIAANELVCLGEGDDSYRAQQSIRTLFNVSQPGRHYVKTSLSILNMGFMRGLSPDYMRSTPAINDWVHTLVSQDRLFAECGFRVLRECAAIGYRQPHFEHAAIGKSPYQKMLSALWRENPETMIESHQRLMTMAALLHIDRHGQALLPQLIRASGLTIDAWLRRYFDAYLTPLLHAFYRHHLVFMPHGENLILVMQDQVPVGAFMKDIGEEVCLLNDERPLPDAVQRIAVTMPEWMEPLSIFTDVFDCFFRYLSALLVAHCQFEESIFWRLVAECIINYQQAHPELAARFQRHDLFCESFPLSCLNRLQLRNNRQMVDLSDPAAALQFAGGLGNPIARYAGLRSESAA